MDPTRSGRIEFVDTARSALDRRMDRVVGDLKKERLAGIDILFHELDPSLRETDDRLGVLVRSVTVVLRGTIMQIKAVHARIIAMTDMPLSQQRRSIACCLQSRTCRCQITRKLIRGSRGQNFLAAVCSTTTWSRNT